MAVVLGYGGIGNTSGARSFAGKAEAEVEVSDTGDLIRTGAAFIQTGTDFISDGIRDTVRRYEFSFPRALLSVLRWAPR